MEETMGVDRYTKIVLTVIAAALVANVAQDYILPAQAAEVQRVAICGMSGITCASVSGSSGLEVEVTNIRDFKR
jgi:hypothetical protein